MIIFFYALEPGRPDILKRANFKSCHVYFVHGFMLFNFFLK